MKILCRYTGILVLIAVRIVRADGQFEARLPPPLSPPEKMTNIQVEQGPYQPTWDSLQAYEVPDWFREAKFGIWAHWGPQAAGRSGDWYARSVYEEGEAQRNHIRNFGHPKEVGYKDVMPKFTAADWNPEELMSLYQKAGARYFMAMGCHHDNIDCWNSKHQPWNTVSYGPHKDIVGLWHEAAQRHGMHFGVSFHADYSWWWYQQAFLGSEKTGPYAGAPYDAARIKKADGQGQWWQGLDPRDLYGKALSEEPKLGKWLDEKEKDGSSRYGYMPDEISDKDYARWYCTKWCERVQDLIHNYHPDLLYYDGGGGDYYPFSGVGTGRGFASDAMQRVTADFYNANLKEHDGKNEAVVNLKTEKGRAIVLDHESSFPDDIPERPWQTDNTIGDWFYRPDCFYDTGMVIHELLEVVSRNGNLMMNVMLSPEGTLDPQGRRTLEEMGRWMAINSEGIFGTRAWTIPREGFTIMRGGILRQSNAMTPYTEADFRFTQSRDGKTLYAYCMKVPDAQDPTRFDVPTDHVIIRALGSNSPLVTGEPASVALLGDGADLKWTRRDDGLEIRLPATLPCQYALCFKINGLVTVNQVRPSGAFAAHLYERPGLIAGVNGGFQLLPNDATLAGPSIRLEWSHDVGTLGYWRSRDDRATWKIKLDRPGTFQIAMEIGTVEDSCITVEAGSQRITAKLPSTGSYDNYRSVEVGKIEMAEPGSIMVMVHAAEDENWKPINLRAVRFIPSR